MAKSKSNAQRKRRTKRYSGRDAAIRTEHVTRIKAVKRNPISQWLHDNRRKLAAWGVIVGVGFIFYFLVSLLIGWIF